jgi:hypothetical protein
MIWKAMIKLVDTLMSYHTHILDEVIEVAKGKVREIQEAKKAEVEALTTKFNTKVTELQSTLQHQEHQIDELTH